MQNRSLLFVSAILFVLTLASQAFAGEGYNNNMYNRGRTLNQYYPGLNNIPNYNGMSIHQRVALKQAYSPYNPGVITIGPNGANVWFRTPTSVPGSSGWTDGNSWYYTRPIGNGMSFWTR